MRAGEFTRIGPTLHLSFSDSEETGVRVAAQPGGDFFAAWECWGAHCDKPYNDSSVDGGRFYAGGTLRALSLDLAEQPTEQYEPALCADPAGNVVVAWTCWGCQYYFEGVFDGNVSDIFARRFDASGAPIGPEFVVNTHRRGYQAAASVGCGSDGSFIVVWTSSPDPSAKDAGQDGDGNGIFGQAFDSRGLPRGSEFQVNSYTTGPQTEPAIAVAASGDFVVVWSTILSRRAGWDPVARIFAADTHATGGEFHANAYTTGDQGSPAIAASSDGTFLIVWGGQTERADYELSSRLLRLRDHDRAPDAVVNDASTEPQFAASVAPLPGGEFVVAWGSGGFYAEKSGIRVRRVAPDGTATGEQLDIEMIRSDDFWYGVPDVSASRDGRFIVVWTGYDVESRGILAARFSSAAEIGPICGDADGDTLVNSNDALRTLAASVGVGICDPRACDVDSDGRVSVRDALRILRISVRVVETLQCPGAPF